MMWVAFLREKYEAFEKFKIFKSRVENESSLKIKCFKSDGGGEFISNEFNNFYKDNGIKRQLSTPKPLEQNRITERRNRSMTEAARAMMIENSVSHIFWREVVNTTIYTINKVKIR